MRHDVSYLVEDGEVLRRRLRRLAARRAAPKIAAAVRAAFEKTRPEVKRND